MKRKITLFLFCIFLLQKSSFSQSEFKPRAKNVDSIVAKMQLSALRDLDQLADSIVAPFETDSEKVRAIYYWLATNIYYDWRKYKQMSGLAFIHLPKGWDYEDYKEDQMEKTIARKRGICGDYANLFERFCMRAHIQCRVISGYAVTHRVSWLMCLDQTETNHAWNAVQINGKWQLVDVTWASGLMMRRGKKIKGKLNDMYYCCNPEELIRTHRPLNAQWQFQNKYVRMKDFVRIANRWRKGEIVSW